MEKAVISCCKEHGYDGCYECPEIEDCAKGFYSNGNDGNAAKAQEILGNDIHEGLRILEENL